MKQIDYDNIHRRAEAARVCPYAWIKRELNFREVPYKSPKNCWICKSRYSAFCAGKVYQSCLMIGVAPLAYKDIDGLHVCDNFERCHEKAAIAQQANTNEEYTIKRGDNG